MLVFLGKGSHSTRTEANITVKGRSTDTQRDGLGISSLGSKYVPVLIFAGSNMFMLGIGVGGW